MAADNVVSLPQRGKVYLTGPNRTPDSTSTTTLAIRGIRKAFKDLDYTSGLTGTTTVLAPRSGGNVECILVRNSSGIALTPGRLVTWKTNLQGKEVDGYATTDFCQVAGVVDEFLPSTGVANNDYFWLVVKGPCLVKKAADTNTLTKDVEVVAVTAASSQAAGAGRIQTLALANNATSNTSMALNKVGVAMSTSNTSGANVLVYLDLPW